MTDIRIFTDEEVDRLTDRSALREALVRYSEDRTIENAVAYIEKATAYLYELCQAEPMYRLSTGKKLLEGWQLQKIAQPIEQMFIRELEGDD